MHIIALVLALAAPPSTSTSPSPSPSTSTSTAPAKPTPAQCDARKGAKVGVAVDTAAPSALTAGVLARLTEQCLSSIGVAPGDDDVAKAKAKGARFLVRVSGKMTKTGETKIEGVTLGTYRAFASAGVVHVADAIVLAEIAEVASVMGPSEDAAAAQTAKLGPGTGREGPAAWRTGDRVVVRRRRARGRRSWSSSGSTFTTAQLTCALP
jgi:hypothetical protein